MALIYKPVFNANDCGINRLMTSVLCLVANELATIDGQWYGGVNGDRHSIAAAATGSGGGVMTASQWQAA